MEGYLAGAACLSRPRPLDSSYITDDLLSEERAAALIRKWNTQMQMMYVSGLLTTKKDIVMIRHWLDSRLFPSVRGNTSLLMEQRVAVYLHGGFYWSKLDEQFSDLWNYCTYRDLKVNQDLLDSKATQVLRSVTSCSSNIRLLFSSHLSYSVKHFPNSVCRDFLALKEQLDFQEIR